MPVCPSCTTKHTSTAAVIQCYSDDLVADVTAKTEARHG